jgi:hypothetical protein
MQGAQTQQWLLPRRASGPRSGSTRGRICGRPDYSPKPLSATRFTASLHGQRIHGQSSRSTYPLGPSLAEDENQEVNAKVSHKADSPRFEQT